VCMLSLHVYVCVTPTVLYTKVDAQCDKLVSAVGRTELTTLATVDVLSRNFSKFRAWDQFQKEIALFSPPAFPARRAIQYIVCFACVNFFLLFLIGDQFRIISAIHSTDSHGFSTKL